MPRQQAPDRPSMVGFHTPRPGSGGCRRGRSWVLQHSAGCAVGGSGSWARWLEPEPEFWVGGGPQRGCLGWACLEPTQAPGPVLRTARSADRSGAARPHSSPPCPTRQSAVPLRSHPRGPAGVRAPCHRGDLVFQDFPGPDSHCCCRQEVGLVLDPASLPTPGGRHPARGRRALPTAAAS